MAKKLEVPYNGTKEQEERLRAGIAEIRAAHAGKGLTIAALQKGQEIFGYLPEKALQIIADELGIPLAEVYGIATFYAQFSLYPKGQYKIGVCLGTACYVKGSGDVYQKLCDELKIKGGECTDDLKFSLDATRCIGCCGLAPVMTVNDDVYGKVTPDEVPKILAKYRT